LAINGGNLELASSELNKLPSQPLFIALLNVINVGYATFLHLRDSLDFLQSPFYSGIFRLMTLLCIIAVTAHVEDDPWRSTATGRTDFFQLMRRNGHSFW